MTEEPRIDIPPLVTMGEPRLARPSAPVDPAAIAAPAFQERLQRLAAAMVEYLGIGIAAPQVGWYERFFIMAIDRLDEAGAFEREWLVWVNPEVVAVSAEQCWAWEGCLSVPGLRGWIRRPAAVAVRGYDAAGERVSREFTGWPARVFQHEHDHLDGLLFPYRAVHPRHIVMTEQLEQRDAWPDGWPAPGARDAPLGEVVPDPPPAAAPERGD